jgi:hypothetical protein
MSNGFLNIGCKHFNHLASRVIVRWLGITPTQFAAARRIGRKVNRRA